MLALLRTRERRRANICLHRPRSAGRIKRPSVGVSGVGRLYPASSPQRNRFASSTYTRLRTACAGRTLESSRRLTCSEVPFYRTIPHQNGFPACTMVVCRRQSASVSSLVPLFAVVLLSISAGPCRALRCSWTSPDLEINGVNYNTTVYTVQPTVHVNYTDESSSCLLNGKATPLHGWTLAKGNISCTAPFKRRCELNILQGAFIWLMPFFLEGEEWTARSRSCDP